MLLIALRLSACSFSIVISSSSSESSKKAPILLIALLFGTSLSGLRSASDLFLFVGDFGAGAELGGYAIGDEISGMMGGDEGMRLSREKSVGNRFIGAYFRFLSGVSIVVSHATRRCARRQYLLYSLPHS